MSCSNLNIIDLYGLDYNLPSWYPGESNGKEQLVGSHSQAERYVPGDVFPWDLLGGGGQVNFLFPAGQTYLEWHKGVLPFGTTSVFTSDAQ